MQIRTRLTLQFIGIVTITLILISIAIYFFSEGHRKEDFYDRLHKKASNTAMLLIQIDEVDINLLKRMEADNPVSLPREKIIIYDYKDQIIYSTDDNNELLVTKKMIDNVCLNNEVRYNQGDYEILGFLFSHQYDRFVVFARAVEKPLQISSLCHHKKLPVLKGFYPCKFCHDSQLIFNPYELVEFLDPLTPATASGFQVPGINSHC
jgi:hypothetical protein